MLIALTVLYCRWQRRQEVVLERIESMDASLTATIPQYTEAAVGILHQLTREVWLNRNQPKEVAIVEECELLVRRARSLADTIQRARAQLRSEAGEKAVGKLQHPGKMTSPDVEKYKQLIELWITASCCGGSDRLSILSTTSYPISA